MTIYDANNGVNFLEGVLAILLHTSQKPTPTLHSVGLYALRTLLVIASSSRFFASRRNASCFSPH
eukprot:COSAG02_NODE_1481_length_12389_cov_15.643857_16_plen_65_part_00